MGLFRAQGNGDIIVQNQQPSGGIDGTIWIDTSQSPHVINVLSGGVYTPALGTGTVTTIGGVNDTLEHFIITQGFS
jgi:hypothetical protein